MNKKKIMFTSTALFIIFLDQSSKYFIRSKLHLNQSIPLIQNFLHFTYITNTGSAFGLFKGLNLAFILISIAVIIFILYFLRTINNNKTLWIFPTGLLLGGTTGNLIDRLFYGAVTDFIDFRIWPVFNIADSAISVSIMILIFMTLIKK